MNRTTFIRFKRNLVQSHFMGDEMYMGYLWLSLTNNQVQEIKQLAIKHAYIIGYRPNGDIRVGIFVLKD